jgi:large subunit ribosomal protein L17
MRHGDKIKNLGRKKAHRIALLENLTCQLIEHKRITTTLAKAKSLRIYAEPIITRAKNDSMHNRRVVFSYLQDKEAIKELFGVIGDKVASRPGGYTRIIKLPRRIGDAADMAMIELVDFNEIYTKDSKDAAAKKTRRGRSRTGTKKTETVAALAPEVTTHTETVFEDTHEVAPIAEIHEAPVAEAVVETPADIATEEAPATETTSEEAPAADAPNAE